MVEVGATAWRTASREDAGDEGDAAISKCQRYYYNSLSAIFQYDSDGQAKSYPAAINKIAAVEMASTDCASPTMSKR